MTQLSVNINKIALIRNSRGRNYPDVAAFSERFLQLGAHGIILPKDQYFWNFFVRAHCVHKILIS